MEETITVDMKVTYRELEGEKFVSLDSLIELLEIVNDVTALGYDLDVSDLLGYFNRLRKA
jgi:hypothetical protein